MHCHFNPVTAGRVNDHFFAVIDNTCATVHGLNFNDLVAANDFAAVASPPMMPRPAIQAPPPILTLT